MFNMRAMFPPSKASLIRSLPKSISRIKDMNFEQVVWFSYNGKSEPNTTLSGKREVTSSNLVRIISMSGNQPCNAEQSV